MSTQLEKVKMINIESFIWRAKEIHGDKYDYSNSVYSNALTKLSITCPVHGEFTQTPNNHVNLKHGCPGCGSGERKGKPIKVLSPFLVIDIYKEKFTGLTQVQTAEKYNVSRPMISYIWNKVYHKKITDLVDEEINDD